MSYVKPLKFQYYYCVNCGHVQDWGFERVKNRRCGQCSYDELTPLTKREYLRLGKVRRLW